MRLPRDISGAELAKRLAALGYRTSRQSGSHMRLTTVSPAQHHITVPAHNPLKLGTLAAILNDVAAHARLSADEVRERLFG